jgi:hypothetical protein
MYSKLFGARGKLAIKGLRGVRAGRAPKHLVNLKLHLCNVFGSIDPVTVKDAAVIGSEASRIETHGHCVRFLIEC